MEQIQQSLILCHCLRQLVGRAKIDEVVSRSKAEIASCEASLGELRLTEARVEASLSFWQEFDEMMGEKLREVAAATREGKKLNQGKLRAVR